jgi:hypothetical protein
MALRKLLILRKLRSSCLEGRTALIQPIVNFLTASKAGAQNLPLAKTGGKGLKSLDSRLRGNDGMSPRPFRHSVFAGVTITLRGVTLSSGGL